MTFRPDRLAAFCALPAALACGGAHRPDALVVDSILVLRNVTVVDTRSGGTQPRSTVVLSGNRIVEIGPAGTLEPPGGARRVDGRDGFLIPGLWDLHVHLGNAGEGSLPLFIANGVTGARDLGSERFEQLSQWRSEIEAGQRVGPRIVAAGPIVDGPTDNWPLRVTVRDTAGARRIVDSLVTIGVDLIKVHQQLTRDQYFGVAAAARARSIPFAGHVPDGVSGIEASNAGQRSLEHMTGIPRAADSAFAPAVAAFLRNGTWIDPTLTVFWVLAHRLDSAVVNDARNRLLTPSLRKFWEDQKAGWSGDMSIETMQAFYAQMLAAVGALHAGGVPLLTGTDLGFVHVFPGSSVHEELEHLVEAGLSPLDALRASTLNPARYLGREQDLGTVETGRLADLVLLDANPLMSISNTRRIRAVIANGRYFDRAELDRLGATP